MKTIFLSFFASLLFLAPTYSQSVISKSISNVTNQQVHVDLRYPSVSIDTWDKNEISIEGIIDQSILEDSDNFELVVNQSNGKISISLKNDDDKNARKVVYLIKDGVRQKLETNTSSWKTIEKDARRICSDCNINSTTIISELTLKIKIPKSVSLSTETIYGDNDIKNFYGPLDIDATYGAVEVIYQDKIPSQRVNLKSTYDDVDISIPSASKADIELCTSYGEVFSNFDIIVKANSKETAFGQNLKGEINGGGSLIKAEATYDNIYLRKL